MAKKRHMTKHQYKAYEKTHHSKHPVEVEQEKIRQEKSLYGKFRKKSHEKIKRHLLDIQDYSDNVLDEEYDDEYELKATRIIRGAKEHKTRLKGLEHYES